MIEVTNLKQTGELNLGFKDKNGKPINFTYGMVLTDEMVDTNVLKESMEKGTLSVFAKKNWVIFKKVNIQGAIIGSPQPFKGLTPQEVEKIPTNKNTAIIPPDNYLDTLIPAIPTAAIEGEVTTTTPDINADKIVETVGTRVKKNKTNKTVKANKDVENTETDK